jgi:hypothetical protein
MRGINQMGKAGLRILGLRETFAAAACSTSKSCFRLPLHSRMMKMEPCRDLEGC